MTTTVTVVYQNNTTTFVFPDDLGAGEVRGLNKKLFVTNHDNWVSAKFELLRAKLYMGCESSVSFSGEIGKRLVELNMQYKPNKVERL